MPILFSLPVGRNTVNAYKRALNALEMNPSSFLILNCDKAIDRQVIERSCGILFNTKIFINPIPRSQNEDANLLESHIRNYEYAKSIHLDFSIVYFLSDQDMFFRKGLEDFIKNYQAGFLICSSFLKPTNFQERDFAVGTLWNQKGEDFWMKGLLLDSKIQRVFSEQIEGEFYCRELFEKIYEYIQNLPIHFTQIKKAHYEEVTFGTIYLNVFQKEYPLFLPVGTIYRSDDIVMRSEDLIKIMMGEREVEAMPKGNAYPFFHVHTFGIKRVRYAENWDDKVMHFRRVAYQNLSEAGISAEHLS
jgi:hypothetical protein